MSDTLTFSYSGAELVPLLSDLLGSHEVELKHWDAELSKYTPGQIEAAQSPAMMPKLEHDDKGNIRVKRDGVMPEVANALRKRDDAWIAKRETELWLLEAYRTPKTRWLLTLRDLGRLYPETRARETLARIQAMPPGPSTWFGRLIGALAALLLPRRQAPRLPASAA